MMNKAIKLLIAGILILIGCNLNSQDNLTGFDVRLFKGSPVWELAKAIDKEDTVTLKELLKSLPKESIDFQEKRFGMNLLYWSVFNSHLPSMKILAEAGANPNLKSNDSTTAFIHAAMQDETTQYLEILLKHGGNVNEFADNPEPLDERTPLIAAANSLENVKLLISAGADPNFEYITSTYKLNCLNHAFVFSNIDVIKYLIIDIGVNIQDATGWTMSGDSLYITDDLRQLTFPLDSDHYKKKMEVVEYIKKFGFDYWSTPIPDYYFKNYEKEYLEKY